MKFQHDFKNDYIYFLTIYTIKYYYHIETVCRVLWAVSLILKPEHKDFLET